MNQWYSDAAAIKACFLSFSLLLSWFNPDHFPPFSLCLLTPPSISALHSLSLPLCLWHTQAHAHIYTHPPPPSLQCLNCLGANKRGYRTQTLIRQRKKAAERHRERCTCVCESLWIWGWYKDEAAGLKVDCTEPFSPCKGLSAVSFVNGCCPVNTVSLAILSGFFFPPLWFESAGRGFCCDHSWKLTDKMGKVMFRDGTKAGRLPAQSPPPPC